MRQQRLREADPGAFGLLVSGLFSLILGLFGLIPGIATVPGDPINKLWVGLVALVFIVLGLLLGYLGIRR